MIYKKAVSIAIVICLLFTFNIANAASGHQGYAAYRDGVLAGLEWHAGVITSTNDSQFIHHSGSGVVSNTDLNGFLNGNNFKGAYYKSGLSSSTYDSVMYMSDRLVDEGDITYEAFYLMKHDGQNSTWIFPENITKTRCDGVVEYCYEFYGVTIMSPYEGYQSWPDISSIKDCYKHHSLNLLTPHIQSTHFTKVN